MEEIIKSAQNGDKEAINKVIEEIESPLYKIAILRLKNEEDAKDIVQNTMLLIYKNLKTLREPKYFKTWATKILINECNKYYKTDLKEKGQAENNINILNHETEINEVTQKIDNIKLLDSLGATDKNIMILHINGYKNSEIAEIMEMNKNTVKTKIRRSKEKIKQNYEYDKKEQNIMPKTKAMRTLISIILVLLVTTGFVYGMAIIVKNIKNLFGANTSEGVYTAVKNGYVAEAGIEIQKADGIEIGVGSFIMDDCNFAMNFNISIDEKHDITEFSTIEIEDLKIVDETGKIVFNTRIPEFETEKMKDKIYMGAYSFFTTTEDNQNVTVSLSATGNPEMFPRSKCLTVTFTKIITKNSQYQGNWKFEIEVPQEFYNREVILYRAVNCNDNGINMNEIIATVSNTAFKIFIPEITTDKVDFELIYTGKNICDKVALQKEYVQTSDGRKFEKAERSDGDGGYNISLEKDIIKNYYQTFNLTKYDATDNITVYILTNKGKEIIIEFEKWHIKAGS